MPCLTCKQRKAALDQMAGVLIEALSILIEAPGEKIKYAAVSTRLIDSLRQRALEADGKMDGRRTKARPVKPTAKPRQAKLPITWEYRNWFND